MALLDEDDFGGMIFQTAESFQLGLTCSVVGSESVDQR